MKFSGNVCCMNSITSKNNLSIHLAEAEAGGFLAPANPVEIAFVKNNDGAEPPAFIQVFPKGPDLSTVDGRKFKLTNPEELAAKLNDAGKPIMIDYDHRSHFMPEDGGDQKAAGWMTSFEVRDNALWAKVEWTKVAASKITGLEYRYFSPEFHTDVKTNEVVDVIAAGLVNRPAFNLVALASAQSKQSQKPEEVKMLEAIAKALGLPEDADEKTILTAIQKKDSDHKTELASVQAKAKTPSVEDFMPRADYDVVLARAETAEKKLTDAETASFKDKVETHITQAVHDGKITPGSKDHYVSLCTDEKALESVMKAVGATPKVVNQTEIAGKPDADKTVLTAEEQSIAASLGVSEEDFAKQKAADAA